MEARPPTSTDEDPFARNLAGRRLGRYQVLTKLASGGMAAVYVGRALGVAGFSRLFAIKVLHPHLAYEKEFIDMFKDEARLAARIHHPNVVATLDINDTPDAGFYLVMDYIEGDHLGALLQQAFRAGNRAPRPVALRILIDALGGLGAAHSLTDEDGKALNLVHRDISPHNIMVGTDGISRLTDFGVAKAEARLGTTREGQLKGKLAYMAPEHASSGFADQRSDLFSMGIILWETLTNRRLFRADNHAATLNKICIEPIPAPSGIDEALSPMDPVLAKALARAPEERFQTAEEFADALEQAAPELGGIGSLRAVGKIVRAYASDKLDHEHELIKGAIASIRETESDNGAFSQLQHEPLQGSELSASGSHPSAHPPAEVPQRPRTAFWLITGALLIVAAVALFLAIRGRRPLPPAGEPRPVSPQVAQPSPESPAPVPTQPQAAEPPVAPPEELVSPPALPESKPPPKRARAPKRTKQAPTRAEAKKQRARPAAATPQRSGRGRRRAARGRRQEEAPAPQKTRESKRPASKKRPVDDLFPLNENPYRR
ncbi:MAG: protein kinase [Proteobacteria bacterium]|nr:protein kinase [Pseudomonadota bacterium]